MSGKNVKKQHNKQKDGNYFKTDALFFRMLK
jgi:hypothetical protein